MRLFNKKILLKKTKTKTKINPLMILYSGYWGGSSQNITVKKESKSTFLKRQAARGFKKTGNQNKARLKIVS